jgi:sarcosine oxidase subunit gamma
VPPRVPRGFPMPRDETHAWLAVTGAHAATMFAKICGVDLRPRAFPQGRVAQTSIARLNGVIVRDDRGGVPLFHLLADCAAAEYLWDCLLDAMAEFDGRPVGLTALRGLGGG